MMCVSVAVKIFKTSTQNVKINGHKLIRIIWNNFMVLAVKLKHEPYMGLKHFVAELKYPLNSVMDR